MTEAAPAVAGLRTRWDIILLCFFAGLITAMQIGKVPPAMSELRVDLGIGMVGVSWVASIFTLIGALLGVGAGVASDRLGHRTVMAISLACIGAGSVLGALSDTLILLLLTRAVEGIGFIGMLVSIPSLVIESSRPDEREFTLGIISPFFPLGFAGMMVLSPLLLEDYGWRSLWYFNAVVAGVFLVIFLYGTRDLSNLPGARGEIPKMGLADILRDVFRPGPLALAMAFFIYGVQWYGLSLWLPTFLVEDQAKTAAAAALLGALAVFLNGAGNFITAWLLRFGVSRWFLLALGPTAMGLLAFGIYPAGIDGDVKIWLAMTYALLSGVLAPTILASVPVHAASADQIGSVNGIVMQTNSIGFLVAPPLFAAVVTATAGWGASAWVMLIAGTIGVASAVGLRGLERRDAR